MSTPLKVCGYLFNCLHCLCLSVLHLGLRFSLLDEPVQVLQLLLRLSMVMDMDMDMEPNLT